MKRSALASEAGQGEGAVIAEQQGHPVVGWVIRVVTVLLTVGPVVGLGVMTPYMADVGGLNLEPLWAMVVPTALLLLAGGLWLAWRVSTVGRQASPPPPPPSPLDGPPPPPSGLPGRREGHEPGR